MAWAGNAILHFRLMCLWRMPHYVCLPGWGYEFRVKYETRRKSWEFSRAGVLQGNVEGFSKNTQKNKKPTLKGELYILKSDSTGNLAATEATSTNIYVTGWAVYDSLNTLYVGLPSSVAASVGVAYLYTERNALITKFTLSHLLHLLDNTTIWTALIIIPECYKKCKCFFKIINIAAFPSKSIAKKWKIL